VQTRKSKETLDVRINCRSWDQFIDFLDQRVAAPGVFIPTDRPVPVDSIVAFRVTTPDGANVSLSAKVVSSIPPPAQRTPGSDRPGMLVEFDAAAHEESRRIKEFLRSIGHSSSSPPAQAVPPSAATEPTARHATPEDQLRRHEPRSQTRPRKRSGTQKSPEALLKELQHKVFQMEQMNDFELLGVTHRPNVDEIKEAYLRLSAACHPHRYARYKTPELTVVATQAFVHVQGAYDRLMNPEKAGEHSVSGRPQRATHVTFQSKRSAIEAAMSDAMRLLEFNQFEGAEAALREALLGEPDFGPARVLLLVCEGRRLLSEGDRTGASERYAAILDIDPQHREAAERIRELGRPRMKRGSLKRFFTSDSD
jgi:curved DNA-binding protein CbpA